MTFPRPRVFKNAGFSFTEVFEYDERLLSADAPTRRKFHVIESQNTRDQITVDRRYKRE